MARIIAKYCDSYSHWLSSRLPIKNLRRPARTDPQRNPQIQVLRRTRPLSDLFRLRKGAREWGRHRAGQVRTRVRQTHDRAEQAPLLLRRRLLFLFTWCAMKHENINLTRRQMRRRWMSWPSRRQMRRTIRSRDWPERASNWMS